MKTSLRVSRKAVEIALSETRREASTSVLPLQGAVTFETLYISLDDRFAAQIVFQRIGFLPFAPESRSRDTQIL
jgi:hypothetical protein